MPHVNGTPVKPVDLFEARCVRDAVGWRVHHVPAFGARTELPVTGGEHARGFVGLPRHLVYAVDASGRAACVTLRTLEVVDACTRGDIPWGDENTPTRPRAASSTRALP